MVEAAGGVKTYPGAIPRGADLRCDFCGACIAGEGFAVRVESRRSVVFYHQACWDRFTMVRRTVDLPRDKIDELVEWLDENGGTLVDD